MKIYSVNTQTYQQELYGYDGPRRSMAERSYPKAEARGSGREEQPHIQGALAARAQEG